MRLHACHGVLKQERTVGNDYVVNVSVDYPFEPALESDDVSDTLNYSLLAEIVKREMALPSNLLEHVAGRIARAVTSQFPLTESVTVDIRKIAPPFSADCDGAGVRIKI
ncbi:MAG: dihydroneopterin aldolase [Prevotella sp.]|nr:dihydroneopterin aldolase [Prevotella sp.]MBR4651507.1 dihydroneopterin aldolase [Prevotella sp.]